VRRMDGPRAVGRTARFVHHLHNNAIGELAVNSLVWDQRIKEDMIVYDGSKITHDNTMTYHDSRTDPKLMAWCTRRTASVGYAV